MSELYLLTECRQRGLSSYLIEFHCSPGIAVTLYSISNSSHSLGLNTLSVNIFRHGMFAIVITPMPASSLAHSVTNCNFFPEYDGVPIIVIGNLKGQKKNMLHYQIPAGVMEDSTCEHFYIDLPDSAQCKRVFDKTIEKCYNSSTWKVEVWAMAPNQTKQNQLQKKRGILSFFSLRHRKKKKATTKNMAQSKSLP